MKNNILNRFAFKDLKTHKKDSISLIVMIFIASLIIFTISFISQTYNKEKYDEYQYKYGTYTYYTTEFDGSTEGKIVEVYGEDIPVGFLDHCILEKYGMDFHGHTLFNVNGNPEVVGIHLSEGKLPKNTNEIAINERYLKEYNCHYEIGDVIELTYKDNLYPYFTTEKVTTSKVKIVGFINEVSEYPLVVKLDKPIDYQLYFVTHNNGEVKNFTVEYVEGVESQSFGFARNKMVDQLYGVSTVAYTLGLIEIITFVIALTLIYSLTIVSFEKKQRDYTLLRSIGITQKQLYYIILIQTLMLSVIPIVIASMFYFLMTLIMNTGVPIDGYLWNIVKVLSIVFIGYFIPAHCITRQSLTGSFEGAEFQHFYYQYKKLHKMRPLYLGYRQLIAFKKSAFLKIAIMAVISFQILNLTSSFSLNMNKKTVEISPYSVGYYIKSEELPEKSSWDFMKDYTSDIHILSYIHSTGESRFPIYCDSETVREYYQYEIEVHEGECLIDGYRLINLKDNFDDIFVFDESIKYVVLHKNDYERYKASGEFLNVIFEFDSFSQRNNMFKSVSQQLSHILFNNTISIDELNYSLMYNHYLNSQVVIESNIKSYIFMMSLIVLYIFLFALEILHHKEDIGTYQLMGMTSNEIKLMYFYKSLLISIVGFVLCGCYYMMAYAPMIRSKDLFDYLVLPPLVTWIIVIIIIVLSLIPLHSILKGSGFDNKLTRD